MDAQGYAVVIGAVATALTTVIAAVAAAVSSVQTHRVVRQSQTEIRSHDRWERDLAYGAPAAASRFSAPADEKPAPPSSSTARPPDGG